MASGPDTDLREFAARIAKPVEIAEIRRTARVNDRILPPYSPEALERIEAAREASRAILHRKVE